MPLPGGGGGGGGTSISPSQLVPPLTLGTTSPSPHQGQPPPRHHLSLPTLGTTSWISPTHHWHHSSHHAPPPGSPPHTTGTTPHTMHHLLDLPHTPLAPLLTPCTTSWISPTHHWHHSSHHAPPPGSPPHTTGTTPHTMHHLLDLPHTPLAPLLTPCTTTSNGDRRCFILRGAHAWCQYLLSSLSSSFHNDLFWHYLVYMSFADFDHSTFPHSMVPPCAPSPKNLRGHVASWPPCFQHQCIRYHLLDLLHTPLAGTTPHTTGVETATKKWGGGGRAKLCHISPGLPLLFLKYIMQKSRKNEERNLNAWDRSFEKLDMPHMYIN